MVIDLTHRISEDMPVYPGTETPEIKPVCGYEDMGCLEHEVTMYSHTGTHMDAPAHILQNGKTLDEFRIDQYFGRAILLDVRRVKDSIINIDLVKNSYDKIANMDFVLF